MESIRTRANRRYKGRLISRLLDKLLPNYKADNGARLRIQADMMKLTFDSLHLLCLQSGITTREV